VTQSGDGGESVTSEAHGQTGQSPTPESAPVTGQAQSTGVLQVLPTTSNQEPTPQTNVVEPVVVHVPAAAAGRKGEAHTPPQVQQQLASRFTGEVGQTPPRAAEDAANADKSQPDVEVKLPATEARQPQSAQAEPAAKTPVPASPNKQGQWPVPSQPTDDGRQEIRPAQVLRAMTNVESVRVVESEPDPPRGQVAAQTDQTNRSSTPAGQNRTEVPPFGQTVEQLTITKSSGPSSAPAGGAAALSEVDAAGRPAVGSEAGGSGQSEVRLAAGEGRGAPESSDRVPQGRVVDYVVRVARANLGRENWQVQIRLSPPQLGTLRLDVSVRQGVLNMQVLAETTEAKHLIDSRLGQLRDALQQNGIIVDRVEVDVRRPTSNDSSQHNGDQTSRQGTGQSGQGHGQTAGDRGGDGHERGRGFGAVWEQQQYGLKTADQGPDDLSSDAVADAARVAVDVTV
jgi:flagellar hook-length control protein FliK